MQFPPPLDHESIARVEAVGLDSVIRLTDAVLGTPLENVLDRYSAAARWFGAYEDYRLGKGGTAAELNELTSRVRKLAGKERGNIIIRVIMRAVDEAIDEALHGESPGR